MTQTQDDMTEHDIQHARQTGLPKIGAAKALGIILLVAQCVLFIALVFLAIVLAMSVLGRVDTDGMTAKSISPSGHFGLIVYAFGSVIAMIAILHQLRKIVRTLLTGDPFVPKNASRLRYIWFIVAITEIMRTIFQPFKDRISNIHTDGFEFDVRLHVWFFVLILIVFAQVFREGARLTADAQLTV